MNALEVVVVVVHCVAAAVERNVVAAQCVAAVLSAAAARTVGHMPDAECCSMGERARGGEKKPSRRHLAQKYRLRNRPSNPEDLECDSDMRS